MSLDNIKSAAIEYAQIKDQIKAMEERLDELKAIIGPSLAGRGETAFSDAAAGVIYTLKVNEMPGRATLDKEKMAADGIDPKKYEKVGKPFITINTKIVPIA
jgi:hypothetical protein